MHGTAIAVGPRAALIRGPSGSGKSDLALRCLVHPASPLVGGPALLVADDQVLVARHGTLLRARAPETLRGKLEVRGLGIIDVGTIAPGDVEIVLLVDLTEPGRIERLPETAPTAVLSGIELPLLRVAPWQASAATKVLLALGGHASARIGG